MSCILGPSPLWTFACRPLGLLHIVLSNYVPLFLSYLMLKLSLYISISLNLFTCTCQFLSKRRKDISNPHSNLWKMMRESGGVMSCVSEGESQVT